MKNEEGEINWSRLYKRDYNPCIGNWMISNLINWMKTKSHFDWLYFSCRMMARGGNFSIHILERLGFAHVFKFILGVLALTYVGNN